ncbi:hypothetical protein SteCoe_18448 [Stentor coeruleus]|uniref:CCHC-type domain-containing protein n=1 Tax=Stentor coeruleus TaxID=5963 RepID=A0A1R2BX01_9CILI|nr:hypothetical protein SteCoe_18448 [Stentor coeruleus]
MSLPSSTKILPQPSLIYIVECSNEKYLIGTIAESKQDLILVSCISYAPQWTSAYPPLRVLRTFPVTKDINEDKCTKIYMKSFGISCVRGGKYRELVLSDKEFEKIQSEISECNDDIESTLSCRSSPIESFESGTNGVLVESDNEKNNNSAKNDIIEEQESDETFRMTKSVKIKEPVNNALCQRCSRTGHKADECFAKTKLNGINISQPKGELIMQCGRCYRSGHAAKDCFAKTRADGTPFTEKVEEVQVSQTKSAKCTRCARTGHSVKDCFAKRKFDGSAIFEKQSIPPTTCSKCNKPWHTAEECTAKLKTNQPFSVGDFNQDTIICSKCLRIGHTAIKCFAKTKANGKAISKDEKNDELGDTALCFRCFRPGHETKDCISSGEGYFMSFFDSNNRKGNFKKYYQKKPQDDDEEQGSNPYKKFKF